MVKRLKPEKLVVNLQNVQVRILTGKNIAQYFPLCESDFAYKVSLHKLRFKAFPFWLCQNQRTNFPFFKRAPSV